MSYHQCADKSAPAAADSAGTGRPPCIKLLDGVQAHIKPAYARLVLVSGDDHVDALDPADTDTLIVSCNWLLWQRLAAAGRHCVYFELGLLDWEPDDGLVKDLYLRANAWIPGGAGGDPTHFRGISLARLFAPEVTMFLRNYLRLERALRTLCIRFAPTEIRFYDYNYDVSVIDPPMRRRIAQDVARDLEISFTDLSAESRRDHSIGERIYAAHRGGPVKRALGALYGLALEGVTRFRATFSKPHRRVLMLVNSNVAEPLLSRFERGLTPVFLGRTVPRKAGLLTHCIKSGMLLVRNGRPARLAAADARRLDEIEADLEAALAGPAEGETAVQRAYVSEQIMAAGRFRDMALELIAAERLLDRTRPQRVVVDGVVNYPQRIVIEIARNRGIPVDYTWHSPHTPNRLKYEALGGDPAFRPCVTRALSWGSINDMWLDAVDGPSERVRVGSPLMSKFISPDWKPAAKDAPPAQTKVLLLQYSFNRSDFAGLNANMYEAFVRTVRDLGERGYEQVRYKLHPGRGRWKRSYFEDIAAHFRLDCEILKSEPYRDCLAWSDIVIGSVLTGAMFETLAAGRAYVGLLLKPHSMDESFYGGFPMLPTLEEIPAALERDMEAEGRHLLNGLYSCDDIADPAKRFWEVLAGDFQHDGSCRRSASHGK